ncbi:hypothetical protein [Billgrantia gudaonensis]|uniref:Lipoprotein n=1 Tax=Billgrantia gudaonensis TaxID=376427 RepID=A0A1G9EAX6_9GAMM|nr:hypothetical protein [Halomonas gudaonensis]SDK73293.1 hypothetical protein SAMN04487954_1266 [Halomonas gudaonensis]
MKEKLFSVFSVCLIATGCAGRVEYSPPIQENQVSNSAVINKPREEVWKDSIPKLGKSFFVINNIDRSSGLINISYSADPEKYINCGQVTSYVKNAQGERTYRFPGARSSQRYEIMNSGSLYYINRSMNLDGRVNIIYEEITPDTTKVTANTHYVVKRDINVTAAANNMSQSASETINFGSGGSASFPPSQNGQATTCVPNGALEEEILATIRE